MIIVGKTQTLQIQRETPHGLFLTDSEGNEVLLPNKYVPQDSKTGDSIDVFIYKDSEDRIIATTLQPYVEAYQYAYLQVKAVNKIGAFMDWGLEKDLLVPFREQNRPMVAGMWYVVYVYRDIASDRLVATTKIKKSLSTDEDIELSQGQRVEVMAFEKTDRGVQVIVDGRYRGILYANELFTEVNVGDIVECYVKNIRTDKLIDLSFQPLGRGRVTGNRVQILNRLEMAGGFLPYGDKTSPEIIQEEFGISKKTFKQIVGLLYKQGRIKMAPGGIQLIK